MIVTRHATLLVLSLPCGSLLMAQFPTAHPQESTANSAISAPFGVTFGSDAEARTQILVPRNELPAVPAQLLGIEVRGLLAAPIVYTSLRIDVAETSADQLQTTFANNLPTSPTTVLDASGMTVSFQPTTWSTIAFTTPHQFSGSAGLVIDIHKIVSPGSAFTVQATMRPAEPTRLDRPWLQTAVGGAGSGAAYAAVANTLSVPPFAFRLVWANTPTLRNRSDATTVNGASYALGGTVYVTAQAAAGSAWWLAIAADFLAAPVMWPGFFGEFRLDNVLLLGNGVLDAQGLGTATIPLPTAPSFVGQYYAYQAVILDPATGVLVFANGIDHFINP